MVLTGLVSFRFNSLTDSSGTSGSGVTAAELEGAAAVSAITLAVASLTARSSCPRVASREPTPNRRKALRDSMQPRSMQSPNHQLFELKRRTRAVGVQLRNAPSR